MKQVRWYETNEPVGNGRTHLQGVVQGLSQALAPADNEDLPERLVHLLTRLAENETKRDRRQGA